MSIISLTIAPLIAKNPGYWATYYWGFIPLVVQLIGSYLVYYFFWREVADITADVSGSGVKKDVEEGGGEEPVKKDEGKVEAKSLMQGEVESGVEVDKE